MCFCNWDSCFCCVIRTGFQFWTASSSAQLRAVLKRHMFSLTEQLFFPLGRKVEGISWLWVIPCAQTANTDSKLHAKREPSLFILTFIKLMFFHSFSWDVIALEWFIMDEPHVPPQDTARAWVCMTVLHNDSLSSIQWRNYNNYFFKLQSYVINCLWLLFYKHDLSVCKLNPFITKRSFIIQTTVIICNNQSSVFVWNRNFS